MTTAAGPATSPTTPSASQYPLIALFERHMGLSFEEVDYKISKLTAREAQVLERIAAGDDTSDIIEGLDIAYSTLASHRKRLAEKFGICTNGGYAKIFWFHRLCGICHPEVLQTHSRGHRNGYRPPEADGIPESEGAIGAGAINVGDETHPADPQLVRGS